MAEAERARYHRQPRRDLVARVPAGARAVLDVGCGHGELGRQLKREPGRRVVGIERDAAAAAAARRVLDEVIEGDVEELEAPAERFDCLVYGDVLEHLRDPWALLARHRRCLREGGHVVVSLPNVRHAAVLAGLLRGRWTYREEGILDRDHLRFFTRSSAMELVTGAGYRLVEVVPGVLGELTARQLLLVAVKEAAP